MKSPTRSSCVILVAETLWWLSKVKEKLNDGR